MSELRRTRPIQEQRERPGGAPTDTPLTVLPGLAATAVLAAASIWLAEFIGVELMGFDSSPISAVMVAILLGMVVGNLLALPDALRPGLRFATKRVLRLGIILLGIRLSIVSAFKLGALGIPIVALCIVGALLVTTWLNNRLRLPERLGTLVAIGTSICGVTAIVAAAPAIDAEEEEVAYSVAVITVFGLVAMLAYPYLGHALFGDSATMAGLFLGTSIHETAQVAGAGVVYADIFNDPAALDAATITKLVRNVFMAAVIPLMAVRYANRSSGGDKGEIRFSKLFPVFILGFLAMAVIRSLGDLTVDGGGRAFGLWGPEAWSDIHHFVKDWAVNFMVVALAGVGLSTKMSMLKGLGSKPFVVGLAAALVVGLISVATIVALGALIVV